MPNLHLQAHLAITAKRFIWVIGLVMVLGSAPQAVAQQVQFDPQSSWLSQSIEFSAMVGREFQGKVEPLTSEIPITGRCSGTFNVNFSGGKRAELCPTQYSIDVPADAETLWPELEREGLRNLHLALAFGQEIGPGVRFFSLPDFGQIPQFTSATAALSRPDLQTGTWFIAIFNFQEASAEPYTIIGSLSPVTLNPGVPWSGSIGDKTGGGMFPDGGELLGLVDYKIDVPRGATELTIDLTNQRIAGDINLYARLGSAVDVQGGQLVADFRSTAFGGTEQIKITSTSTPPLQSGTYYIKVGNREGTRQLFTLKATAGGVQPPTIELNPRSFTFNGQVGGPTPLAQTLTITNTGGGTLNWTITTNAPWLTVSSARGTARSVVMVSVNIAGLTAGTQQSQLVVEATGATNSPQTIPVTLTLSQPVQPPLIRVSPSSLSFTAVQSGSNPAAQTLTITNGGGGVLNWTASANAPWLSLDPASGTAPSNVTVSVNIAGLATGTQAGQITITASGAANSPVTVPVTLAIIAQPAGGALLALKFIKLEFLSPSAWERTVLEGCVIYKNISGGSSKIRVTLPDKSMLEFDIPAAKEVLVCGDVVHIDTRR